VSIIPGIDTAAPDLTESKRGAFGSPNFLFVDFSKTLSYYLTYFIISSGIVFLFFSYKAHPSVTIVKPGGTGIPILHISARLAPLPPRIYFISFFPSDFSLEKK
jgi:hypothetical protein